MNEPQRIRVRLGDRGYDVLVGPGIRTAAMSWDGLGRDSLALVVTDEVVGRLHGAAVVETIRPRFAGVEVVTLPPGEATKVWASVESIVDALLSRDADRRSTIVALGGGVIGDVAGFAAACYMRGIDCVQVPTTLLAQVDSSVGGKTAINHSRGKNMIGAFHQPRRVLADIDVLATLPRRELAAGLAEVIKYGAIADDEFLRWLEGNLERLLSAEPAALQQAIVRSCEIKARIVAADEHESGVRETLNFGHTFGHAIETGLGYGTWLHGEAVGCGMVLAARASAMLGLLDASRAERLERLVLGAGLPTQPPPMAADRWVELMRNDKKARAGELRLVLLDGPGSARTVVAPESLVRSTLETAQRSAA